MNNEQLLEVFIFVIIFNPSFIMLMPNMNHYNELYDIISVTQPVTGKIEDYSYCIPQIIKESNG